jgi:hypothetical protein
MKKIFIRNDDVRNTLDKSLIDITNICVENCIPISHAVEPANVSKEVVNYLLHCQHEHPNLIEIIQHGYDHQIMYSFRRNGKNLFGEFGGNRNFTSQFTDLKKGFELMENHFGNSWYQFLTLPFGSFNDETIMAIQKIGYKGISTSVAYSRKHRIKDFFGHLFCQNILFDRPVSYHMLKRPKSNIVDISISINIIKQYINECEANHFSNIELLQKIEYNSNFTDNIGILLHHRYHRNIYNELNDLIIQLKTKNKFTFTRIQDLV